MTSPTSEHSAQVPVAWQVAALGVSILICFAAMALGGTATASSVREWYPTLDKPPWTPPSYLFGVVWPILYLFMAIAAWLIYREGGFARAPLALSLFAIQLALNTFWSFVFFQFRLPGFAFLEILLLWGVLAATVVAFYAVRPLAAALLLPYLAWVTFAATLNFAIWQRN